VDYAFGCAPFACLLGCNRVFVILGLDPRIAGRATTAVADLQDFKPSAGQKEDDPRVKPEDDGGGGLLARV